MLKEPPEPVSGLLKNEHDKSGMFLEDIRAYNMMHAFTSMGGKIDSSINQGRGPYVFRLHGQNYHRMGSLLPVYGEAPKFSQLYIHETVNEVANRKRAMRYCVQHYFLQI